MKSQDFSRTFPDNFLKIPGKKIDNPYLINAYIPVCCVRHLRAHKRSFSFSFNLLHIYSTIREKCHLQCEQATHKIDFKKII